LRMTRFLPQPTEVIHGTDQPLTEVPAPDPVDHDSRRQGIVRGRQPASQFQPAARLRRQRSLCRTDQYEGEPPRHDLARGEVIAATEYPRIRSRGLANSHGRLRNRQGERTKEDVRPRFAFGLATAVARARVLSLWEGILVPAGDLLERVH